MKKSKDLTTPVVACIAAIGIVGFWIYMFNLPGDSERRVTASEFGDEWPFYVQSGTLKCLPGRAIIFEGDNGKTYPVNGTAVAMNEKLATGWNDIREIWKPHPDPSLAAIGVKAPGDLSSIAFQLCE